MGVFVSIVKSGGDPFRVYAEVFWKVFGIDKDYLAKGNAQAKYIEDVLVTNKTAYYVGKIVGDVAAIILGIHMVIKGMTGTVAGAITSVATTASGQVYLVPVGVGVTVSGIAITTTGAGIAISAFSDLAKTGNQLKEENKGDSETGKKPTSQNQLQNQVEKGQAPKEVDRVDKPHVDGQQPHVHF